MSILSDIIKTGTESVISELSEDSVTLTVGATTYSIKCVVTNPAEMIADNGSFEIAQRAKKFTFIKPAGITIDRNSYITFDAKKWNLSDVTNGYGNILEATGICDTTNNIKSGVSRLGR